MQQYKARKVKVITTIAVLASLLILSATLGIDAIVCLTQDQKNYTYAITKSSDDFECPELCPQTPKPNDSDCCPDNQQFCVPKKQCYFSYLDRLEYQVDKDSTLIIITMISSFILICLIVLASAYFCVLRKKARYEQDQMRENLIRQEEGNINFQEENQVQFESFEELIQFLIRNGYIRPWNAPKRGPQKIKDSFTTVDENDCAICIDCLQSQKVIELPCQHIFHSACIREWCKANPTCPVCRADIYRGDEEVQNL